MRKITPGGAGPGNARYGHDGLVPVGGLSAGGEPGQCGWLKDRFGVSWQIVPAVLGQMLSDPDAEKAQRVMHAMLQMGKIDIAELERARDRR